VAIIATSVHTQGALHTVDRSKQTPGTSSTAFDSLTFDFNNIIEKQVKLTINKDEK
jgi:hypothetical protein